MRSDKKRNIDPDPLSLLLIVLGAAGSIASLLSYADEKRDERNTRERRSRERILDSISIARDAINNLRSRVELIEVIMHSEGPLNPKEAEHGQTLGFGKNTLILNEAALNRWRSIQNDVHGEVGVLLNAVLSLSLFFASSDYKLSERVESEFRSGIKMLNDLLISLNDPDIDALSMKLIAALRKLENAFQLLEENVGALLH